MDKEMLLSNLDRLHTTTMGTDRIKRNLSLDIEDVVEWCKTNIKNKHNSIEKKGKNWYVSIDDYKLTINASSYTIITAHKKK